METRPLNHREVPPEKPSSSAKGGLPDKKEVQNSITRSISKGQKKSLQQHGYNNSLRTFASASLMVSSPVGTSGSVEGGKRPALHHVQQEKFNSQPFVSQSKCTALTRNHMANASSESSKDPTISAKSGRISKTSAVKDPAPPAKRSGVLKGIAPPNVWRETTNTSPSTSRSEQPQKYTAPSGITKTNGRRIQKTSAPKDPAPPIDCSIIRKMSALSQVQKEKTKAESSSSRSKPSSEHAAPIHHITWNGFEDEPCEPVGLKCCLCDEDLSNGPTDNESEYYDAFERSTLPEVSILACGHAFHSTCLQLATDEEQSREPPCFLCLSCLEC